MSEQIPTPRLDELEDRIKQGSFWQLDLEYIQPVVTEARKLEALLFASVQGHTWNQCHQCPFISTDECVATKRVRCVERYLYNEPQSIKD